MRCECERLRGLTSRRMVGLVGSGGVTDSPVDTVLERQVAECKAEGPCQSGDLARCNDTLLAHSIFNCTCRRADCRRATVRRLDRL